MKATARLPYSRLHPQTRNTYGEPLENSECSLEGHLANHGVRSAIYSVSASSMRIHEDACRRHVVLVILSPSDYIHTYTYFATCYVV